MLGGLLAQFLGWRSIFWFLAIFCAVFMVPFLVTFPETGRNVVGNGSIPPQGWNMSLLNYLESRKAAKSAEDTSSDLARMTTRERQRQAQEALAAKRKIKFPNPLHTIYLLFEKELGTLLLYNAIIYIAFMVVAASLPSLFAEIYHYNDLQIGLSFLPFGAGGAGAAFTGGKMLDWNYRRLCKKHGISTSKKRQVDLRDFPLEKARLEIIFPMVYMGAAAQLIYGWLLQYEVHVAAPLTFLLIMGYCLAGGFNLLSTLLVDLHQQSSATATAANNLVRCLLGAGATALVIPMIDGMGRGWCFTFMALFLTATSPLMMILWRWGPAWREEKRVRLEKEAEERENRHTGKEGR